MQLLKIGGGIGLDGLQLAGCQEINAVAEAVAEGERLGLFVVTFFKGVAIEDNRINVIVLRFAAALVTALRVARDHLLANMRREAEQIAGEEDRQAEYAGDIVLPQFLL